MNGQPEIQINLINYKIEKQMSMQTALVEWGIYLLVGLLVLGGIFFFSHTLKNQITALNKENVSLQNELKQSSAQVSALQTSQKIEDAINTRSKLVSSLTAKQSNFVPVLDELGQLDGSGLLISNIDIKPDTINVKGYASGHRQMVNLLQDLRGSDYFSDPANLQLNTSEETGEISFSMQMSLEVKK
jgi:Tfp pilus assembly protein PilN